MGDNFHRAEPYTTELQQLGIEVLYGSWYALNWKSWLKEHGAFIDYVYLMRPHITLKYIDSVKALNGPRILYQGHDLHYLRVKRQYEIEQDQKLLKSAEEWQKKEFEIFEKVDVIHYFSDVEVKEISRHFPEACIRQVPLYMFDEVKLIPHRFAKRHDLLFVGGFGHPPNVDGVHWFAAEVVPKILERDAGIKFNIVGSNMPESIKNLSAEQISIIGEVSDEELAEWYQRCRVVVIPLRYGAGVKGKVLESLRFQVPVVTTDIGAEGLPDAHNYLKVVNDAAGFASAIVNVYFDEAAWSAQAETGRLAINRNFSKQHALDVLCHDIQLR